jgi:SAM-dependent methyltransferase
MKKLLNIITPLHKKTQRDYLGRMKNNKVQCMKVAKQYGCDFWDGERRYGYGGYKYDGRWRVVAEKLIAQYSLPKDARILDVGCGKGYLLYEFKMLLPGARIAGFDSSPYALANAKEEVRPSLFLHSAEAPFPFKDKEFDLAVSLNTLYNLPLRQLKSSLIEVERVGREKYITLESYRNETELFNLECWALTCATFLSDEDWVWLFNELGYTGDYEFIYFE